MKVTVIGEWGGFPKVNGASAGYLVQVANFNLLVDCGSAVLSKLQQYIDVEKLDAVILSHYHHDHIADIGPLQHARLVKRQLGMTQQTLPIYGHPHDKENLTRLESDPDTKAIAYDPSERLQLGPIQIDFLETKHTARCYAMKLTAGNQTVVYSADSAYMDEFIPFSKGADLFICEANFYDGMNAADAGHMTSTEAGMIAAGADVGQLLLTHLPHFGDINQLVTEAQKMYSGDIVLATEGLVWGEI